MMRLVLSMVLGTIMMSPAAYAAKCPAGQFVDNNGNCTDCGSKQYCPGDDKGYDCPSMGSMADAVRTNVLNFPDSANVTGDSVYSVLAENITECTAYFGIKESIEGLDELASIIFYDETSGSYTPDVYNNVAVFVKDGYYYSVSNLAILPCPESAADISAEDRRAITAIPTDIDLIVSINPENRMKCSFGVEAFDAVNNDESAANKDKETATDLTQSKKTISSAAAQINKIAADAGISVWRDRNGNFNTARLASDSVAGVVLGTAGGIITNKLIKKSQVSKGFDSIQCTVGGQIVAHYGDEFSVGAK